MKGQEILILVIIGLSVTSLAAGQVRRCFSFTWLGPRYTNESVFMNATCDDATRLADGVPCFQPLVVSYDGSRPDTDYIWTNHAEQASCILTDTDVCAVYEYYFNGIVVNSTHMCTMVIDSRGSSVSSGCFTEINGNYQTRVCFCRSLPGGVPCNHALKSNSYSIALVLGIVATTYFSYS